MPFTHAFTGSNPVPFTNASFAHRNTSERFFVKKRAGRDGLSNLFYTALFERRSDTEGSFHEHSTKRKGEVEVTNFFEGFALKQTVK